MSSEPLPFPRNELLTDGSERFINRELSWLQFNSRVLGESLDPSNALLERVKFLSIFSTNLDEFFMVRVSGLRRQMETGVISAPPDGMTPVAQLAAIRERLLPLNEAAARCWRDDLHPKLLEAGIKVLDYAQLAKKQRKLLRRHFKNEIFPVLTPLAFDPGHPFPHISSLSLNLAVVIDDPTYGRRFARLKVPSSLPRLLRVPDEETAEEFEGLELVEAPNFVWIEQVIAANLDLLFPGYPEVNAYPFRVTRDADQEIERDEGDDLLTAMAEIVEQRHFGSAIRLEIDQQMPAEIREILVQNLSLQAFQVFTADGPIGLAGLSELYGLERPELKDPPFQPAVRHSLSGDESVFHAIRRRDILLHHPYDSFAPVVNFLRQAATDPKVVAIKQTLYRVGQNSPIVAALQEARLNGKQVAALVELKARFDEETNITWARALERVGVHVVYGLVDLKTHAKISLVVRREKDGIRRYVHLATGNYNAVTARIYTDLGFFTADRDIARDVSDLFNSLTGYSNKLEYRRLLVAPIGMRDALVAKIDREIEAHKKSGDGRLIFKMNALVDESCIQALYKASQAGVQIDLLVRGICCLRPGLPGLSETIRVTSIVGRFLEHCRVYYFHNGGDEEIYLGSADLMPRNLNGRVEVLFPVDDRELATAVRNDILMRQLEDTLKAHVLQPDGSYHKRQPGGDEEPLNSQEDLLEGHCSWRLED